MVAPFPLVKIAFIFVKQVSKPLANAVKTRAKNSPFFRNYICMPPAQLFHRMEVRMKMWSMNLGKPANIPKLNEAMAIEFGSELIGETVIFGIATIVLLAEYVRSSRKEAAKEEERKQEILRIQEDLKSLYMKNASLETQVRELIRIHRVTVPTSTLSVDGFDGFSDSDLPVHLRERKLAEEKGILSSMYTMIWDAVELVLPSSESATHPSESETASSTQPKQGNTKQVAPSSSALQNNTKDSSPNPNKSLEPDKASSKNVNNNDVSNNKR